MDIFSLGLRECGNLWRGHGNGVLREVSEPTSFPGRWTLTGCRLSHGYCHWGSLIECQSYPCSCHTFPNFQLLCPSALPESGLRPQECIQHQRNKESLVLMLSHCPWCLSPAHRLRGVAQTACGPAGWGGSVEAWRLYKALKRDLSAPSSPPAAMWFLVCASSCLWRNMVRS